MSAWVARVESDPQVTINDPDHIRMMVRYYDATDSAFVTPLGEHEFAFDSGAQKTDWLADVTEWGVKLRATLARRSSIAAQVKNGFTVSIP